MKAGFICSIRTMYRLLEAGGEIRSFFRFLGGVSGSGRNAGPA
jgi:hypothetical protein